MFCALAQVYSHVLMLFFKRMAECDYSFGNEEALALLAVCHLADCVYLYVYVNACVYVCMQKVQGVFTSQIIHTLDNCSIILHNV